METYAVAFAIAGSVFVIFKIAFGFLAWLFPESDTTYRSQLDALFDLLDSYTLFELGHSFLQRIVSRIQSLLENKKTVFAIIIIGSLLFNAIVALAGIATVSAYNAYSFGPWVDNYSDFWGAFLNMPILKSFGTIFIVGVLGTIFDFISVLITLVLIRMASRAKSIASLLFHIGIDILVTAISLIWAYFAFTIILDWAYQDILKVIVDFEMDPADFIHQTMAGTLAAVPELWYVIIGFGLSTALPTLGYLSVLLGLLILRIIPSDLQKFFKKIVFLITTDRKPVLKQLANFFSSSAGFLAAALKLAI